MSRRATKWLGLVSLVLASLACRPLSPAVEGNQAASQPLPSADMVPAEWGRLVAVSEAAQSPNASLLWFQDDSGNVRMVGFDRTRQQLLAQSVIIRRQ